MALVIFLALIAVIALYFISLYNNLVALKHGVARAWSNIDVLMKQRHDELPKLVEACRQYMRFESETLERVMRARAEVASAREARDIPALGGAETALRAGLGQLFATVEAYPELSANEHFRHLLARITELEDAIADRRETYNDAVNLNNVRIEQFPDALIAHGFNFGAARPLHFKEAEKSDVDVKQLFQG
ncbi:LemA family protein [Chitiniphilus purpureus]|uniref:LemA family protein n=1 Tax=Chitiniphilus purpureus TaxID=2981137 RepID=A0ABY6DKJ4_9NEIS|nr:LemA family protein [Chitiniphilus sp. CD1]UXY14885.1 LemA family protein [Chitiniphilus sp. CD1]